MPGMMDTILNLGPVSYTHLDVYKRQVQAIRTLDDTRLVDEASGWYDQGGGDVCSIHNYFYPLHVKPGSRTVALSEYPGTRWT